MKLWWRDGYVFKLPVVYERLPNYCTHCRIIGHDITVCKWIQQAKEEDQSKQIIKVKKEAVKVMRYVEKKPTDAQSGTAHPINRPKVEEPTTRVDQDIPVLNVESKIQKED
ncbi:hypothetical protein A2U01_0049686, partial [Trifolium medium]|nr:hypothetical protein [Trifolium medium]